MRVVNVVGARPQFIKAAAIHRAIACSDAAIEEVVVHTGQHYSDKLSRIFFDQLELPEPAINLGVGSGSHAFQTGRTMEKFEEYLLETGAPDWVIVYGDTNSTLACALAAAKLHIPLAHVEAGLRGRNKRVPEEINRVIADYVADVLFCPSERAEQNLAMEGRRKEVYAVGDVMYDSARYYADRAAVSSTILDDLRLEPDSYYLATVHRAESTDDEKRLRSIIFALEATSYPVVLPLHPRTRKMIARFKIHVSTSIRLIDPVSYFDMLVLEQSARIILTDSGGMQKEAYWFKTPCITMEDERTWDELFEDGYNILTGADSSKILDAVDNWETTPPVWRGGRTLYGHGDAADQIIRVLGARSEA